MHAKGSIKYPLHNLLAICLEQLYLKDLTNIVKTQDVIACRTWSNSVTPKENQYIKVFLPNNHFELMQRMLNLKFMSKIK